MGGPHADGGVRVVAPRDDEVELFSLAGHDGHLREVNTAFARLLGFSQSAPDGCSLLELVHPEDIQPIVEGLAALEARAGDVLARFGGEEFALVLPGVDDDQALQMGRRLVEAARAVTVRRAPGWGMSVSVGTASCHLATSALTSTELLRRADEALYAAKAAGKDRATGYQAP